MNALLSPTNRRLGVKWGPVVYTTLMFSFVTIFTAMNLYIQSISYIDNREYPGQGDSIPPGPLGYQYYIYSKAISVVPNLMFLLNNWMADGLLVSLPPQFTRPGDQRRPIFQLYRCYIIYSMNPLVIAFPSLMYLASVGTYSISPRGRGIRN